MEMLRVVFRDDVFVDDATDVLRSLDELAKIVIWTGSEDEPPKVRPRSSGRSWRIIEGLRIARILPGSELFDLVSVVAATGGTGVLVTLLLIAERVLKDRPHRLTMNQIAELKAYEELNHKKAKNRIDEVNQLVDLRNRLIAVDTSRTGPSPTSRISKTPDPNYELQRKRQQANALGVRNELDAGILGLALDDRELKIPLQNLDMDLVDAYGGAVTAIRRMRRAQMRREPVEDIYLINEDIP
jgi:hypothetical protein